ncbi:hypothetical protein Dda_1018 [Drechslerella dactyloides]|uniref:Nonsense-mediated mRNA decay factor n=1 Tax=Drechslerella dactyloides TaxID=74499 RepID=A0AAD6NNU7_DREDA|nr:hypothetical protein Dda_1018 [Drechslerella dactyloides]
MGAAAMDQPSNPNPNPNPNPTSNPSLLPAAVITSSSDTTRGRFNIHADGPHGSSSQPQFPITRFPESPVPRSTHPLDQLLLPAEHPDFNPFRHDPLLIEHDGTPPIYSPAYYNLNINDPEGIRRYYQDRDRRYAERYAQELNNEYDDDYYEDDDGDDEYDDDEYDDGGTHSDSDTQVAPSNTSQADSSATAVNPVHDYRHVLAGNPQFYHHPSFAHGQPQWSRHDVVEPQQRAGRELSRAVRETLHAQAQAHTQAQVQNTLVSSQEAEFRRYADLVAGVPQTINWSQPAPQQAPQQAIPGQGLEHRPSQQHLQSRPSQPQLAVHSRPSQPQIINHRPSQPRFETRPSQPTFGAGPSQSHIENRPPQQFPQTFAYPSSRPVLEPRPDCGDPGPGGPSSNPRRIASFEELLHGGRIRSVSQLGNVVPDSFDNPFSPQHYRQQPRPDPELQSELPDHLQPHVQYRLPTSAVDIIDYDIRMREVEWGNMRDKSVFFEEEVNRILQVREAGDQALERELDEKTIGLRNVVERMLFEDIEYCFHNGVAEKCWLTHHKIVVRYSKSIASMKKDGNKPVELRKLHQYFGKFIKHATKFYRALIQRLISHYGLNKLKFVAQEFKFENAAVDPSDKARDYTSEIQNIAVFMCYESLLHLGDLSRYRENYGEPNPRNPDARNWGPAKGYYSLARKVLPTHPKAFNQLAVLAQYEHSNFTAIYYLYRSLLAEEPDEATHELTLGNLRVCFSKILRDYAVEVAPSEEITSIFSRYHAHCFLSNDVSEYESLKSDLLNQITLAVKERAVPAAILNRMILINIAAEHLALSRDRATLNSPKVVTFLRFNIEAFTSILMVLQQELDGTSQDSRENVADLVSAVTRRMLPSLRLYSAWLLISHHILVNETSDMSLNVQVKQLWQTYATTLSLLLSSFPMGTLKPSHYVLEEDEDIAGFKPLMEISDSRRVGKELPKDKELDHPNQESLARILYLIEDGIELCTPGTVPIEIKNNTFAFQDGIISTDSNTGNAEYPSITLRDIPVNTAGVRATSTASRLGQANPMGSVISEPVSTTMTNKMNAMVDDLVGSSHSREDSDEEDEVVLWKGRRAFYQGQQANPKASTSSQAINNATITAKTPMVAQAFAQPGVAPSPAMSTSVFGPFGKGKATVASNYMAPYAESASDSAGGRPIFVGNRAATSKTQLSGTASESKPLTASELVSYVRNYTSRMTLSPQGSSTAASGGGSSAMAVSQPGAADPVTPKLSSASLERTKSSTPPLDSLNVKNMGNIQRVHQGNVDGARGAYNSRGDGYPGAQQQQEQQRPGWGRNPAEYEMGGKSGRPDQYYYG